MIDRRSATRFVPRDVEQVHARFQKVKARALRRLAGALDELKRQAKADAARPVMGWRQKRVA